jgi:hypothetical protein
MSQGQRLHGRADSGLVGTVEHRTNETPANPLRMSELSSKTRHHAGARNHSANLGVLAPFVGVASVTIDVRNAIGERTSIGSHLWQGGEGTSGDEGTKNP